MKVVVHGVGTSHFGKQEGRTLTDLGRDAVTEALAAADVTGVDAVYVGTVFGAPGCAQRVLHTLGIVDVPIVTIENACASGTSAFAEAVANVRSGRHERVLALGLEQLSTRFDGPITPESTDPEGRSGMALPSLYAMSAHRYLQTGAATLEQLAAVSVKNHRHAVGNPRAQYAGEYTIEDVLGSPMIADPLTLLQCCPLSDGAAAAVVAPSRGDPGEVRVLGLAQRSGGLWDHRTDRVWGHEIVARTSLAAYEDAGLGPQDADVIEVHDAFTIGELVTLEALGVAPHGKAGELTVDGHTTIGGAQPVNPSGGLLSRGHPLGATGLAQIAEIVWQLRGRAGDRQVDGARIGLVETMGGGVSGIDGNACVVALLGRDGTHP